MVLCLIEMCRNDFLRILKRWATNSQSICIPDTHVSVYVSRRHATKRILTVFTYKTAAKINWHRYGTKLRHCHVAVYKLIGDVATTRSRPS